MTNWCCILRSQKQKIVGNHDFKVWVGETKNRPLVIRSMWFVLEDSGGNIPVHISSILVANVRNNTTNSQGVEERSELVSGCVRRQVSDSPLILKLFSGLLTVLIGSGSKTTADRKKDKNPKEWQEKNPWEAALSSHVSMEATTCLDTATEPMHKSCWRTGS